MPCFFLFGDRTFAQVGPWTRNSFPLYIKLQLAIDCFEGYLNLFKKAFDHWFWDEFLADLLSKFSIGEVHFIVS